MKTKEQKYNEYVKKVTPTSNTWLNMFHAFWMGGLICVIGQFITNTFLKYGLEKEAAGKWTLVIIIGITVLLTGFNIFSKLAK